MELETAIHGFTNTLATIIPIALGITIACVVGYISIQEYLRKRAAQRSRIWRDL